MSRISTNSFLASGAQVSLEGSRINADIESQIRFREARDSLNHLAFGNKIRPYIPKPNGALRAPSTYLSPKQLLCSSTLLSLPYLSYLWDELNQNPVNAAKHILVAELLSSTLALIRPFGRKFFAKLPQWNAHIILKERVGYLLEGESFWLAHRRHQRDVMQAFENGAFKNRVNIRAHALIILAQTISFEKCASFDDLKKYLGNTEAFIKDLKASGKNYQELQEQILHWVSFAVESVLFQNINADELGRFIKDIYIPFLKSTSPKHLEEFLERFENICDRATQTREPIATPASSLPRNLERLLEFSWMLQGRKRSAPTDAKVPDIYKAMPEPICVSTPADSFASISIV